MKYKNIEGQKFGHLTVIEKDSRRDAKGRYFWICRCGCGQLLSVRGDQLRLGVSTRCNLCARSGRPSVFIERGDEHGTV